MTCDQCKKRSGTYRYFPGIQRWLCPECGGFSSQVLRDGYLTRNSFRVTRDTDKHRADFVPPHVYDRYQKREVLNPEFVKLYPDKVKNWESKEQMEVQGYPKLAKYTEKLEKQKEILDNRKEVVFAGNTKEGIKKVLKGTGDGKGSGTL